MNEVKEKKRIISEEEYSKGNVLLVTQRSTTQKILPSELRRCQNKEEKKNQLFKQMSFEGDHANKPCRSALEDKVKKSVMRELWERCVVLD